MAGSAFANDGTMLIYDLTELGRKTPVSTGSDMLESHGTPQADPAARASRAGRGDMTFDWSDGNLELKRRDRTPRSGSGTGFHNTQPQNDPSPGATPTPEPGTLFLMGSGVAAGARYLRRRKSATA
jgi:hypothetical protein